MTTQAPVREEQQTRGQPGITVDDTAERQSPVVPEVSQGADDGYRARPTAALVVMSATSLLSAGALLGARFISRRMTRDHRSIRVKRGSTSILIMLPFTAVNFSGKRARRFALPRLRSRSRKAQQAGIARWRTVAQLPARVRQRLARRH
jgi:hypothetical protein